MTLLSNTEMTPRSNIDDLEMTDRRRIVLTRTVTGALLVFLLLRLCHGVTLSGLSAPVLFSVDMDISYWGLRLSGLPGLVVQHRAMAVLFDLLLFGSGALAFMWPLRRGWLILFSGLLAFYAMTFNLYATHHFHQVTGFIIVLLPFWIGRNATFGLAWEGMRYFTCLIYVLAFAWKAAPGNSFWYWDQGAHSVQSNLADYIAMYPDAWMTGMYRWFLQHHWILNAGEKCIVLLEGVMVIGFFTRRADRWLIWIPVFIHVTTYYFSDVYFIELLVLDLSLLSYAQLDRLGLAFGRGRRSRS